MRFEEALQRIKTKKRWYHKSYSGYLFGLAQQGIACARSPQLTPFAIPYGLFFQNHTRLDHFEYFWETELLVQKRHEILDAAARDRDFARTFHATWKAAWDAYLACWESLAPLDFSKMSVDEIRTSLLPLHERLMDCATNYVVDTFLNDTEEDWLEQLIRNELREKATAEVIATLTAPVFESFVSAFEAGKLRIARDMKNGKDTAEIDRACAALAQDYFWIRVNYKSYDRVTAQDVLREVRQEADAAGPGIDERLHIEETRVSENTRRKEELMDQLSVSEALRRVIEVSELFTHIQDKRKEGVLRNNVLFFKALETVAHQVGIERELFFYLTPTEFLSKQEFERVDWHVVRARREKGVLLILCDDQIFLLPREQYEKEVPLTTFFPEVGAVKEIRGSTAYKGKVRGTVRVARNVADIGKFEEGEILVANQTTPEYVPAMKMAIAFITDQGGITCHAAIVSREMKKPCIIGTKIATKVLKDGDEVEVDAEQGLVRVLKRA